MPIDDLDSSPAPSVAPSVADLQRENERLRRYASEAERCRAAIFACVPAIVFEPGDLPLNVVRAIETMTRERDALRQVFDALPRCEHADRACHRAATVRVDERHWCDAHVPTGTAPAHDLPWVEGVRAVTLISYCLPTPDTRWRARRPTRAELAAHLGAHGAEGRAVWQVRWREADAVILRRDELVVERTDWGWQESSVPGIALENLLDDLTEETGGILECRPLTLDGDPCGWRGSVEEDPAAREADWGNRPEDLILAAEECAFILGFGPDVAIGPALPAAVANLKNTVARLRKTGAGSGAGES